MDRNHEALHVASGLGAEHTPVVDGGTDIPAAVADIADGGSHGMAATDYPGMLTLIEQGLLRPELLIERTVGLAAAASLLRDSTGLGPRA